MTDLGQSIPGYSVTKLPIPDELAGTEEWTYDQWRAEFTVSRESLTAFFAGRDPLIVLARTALQYLMQGVGGTGNLSQVRPLEQVELEIAQAFVLMTEAPFKAVPTSPGNFVRYWALMSRHIHGFIRKQPETPGESELSAAVRRGARLQTLYYRNLFSRQDCESTILAVLSKLDQQSEAALGYRLSELFASTVKLATLVEGRVRVFGGHLNDLLYSPHREKVEAAIEFFRSSYPVAGRAWRYGETRFEDLEQLRLAGFQMSELSWPTAFTFDRATLAEQFPAAIVDALYDMSLAPGELKDTNPEHIYLNNPIWKKPYIRLADGSLFAALPQLVFSFPFAIVEGLMVGHKKLEVAYEDARADHLEQAIAALLSTAMPSAIIYRGVVWDDPNTDKTWENDVVALLGNFIFVFEAKSGRIKDAARRGGDLSLRKNFKELFVEPGEQGWRLQNFLDTCRQTASFRLKSDNSTLDFQLDRPKVVFRYSVCFEHFANLTSARHYLTSLGLIGSDTAWAPVLSLGELHMICRYLDTELAVQHYLTRRSSIDDLIEFEGDEQDILSLYLTNGLYLDRTELGSGPIKGVPLTAGL
ncbi:hypothetical protein [Stappia sp. TSB10GB4]|uniref:hypothetical protein n=1 Tax=Stappia sp. TSB10GB4 TaxID=2003584 RepID=UPI0016495092|nr:hypothetical protein [Stappia sp. TSB10GB4]